MVQLSPLSDPLSMDEIGVYDGRFSSSIYLLCHQGMYYARLLFYLDNAIIVFSFAHKVVIEIIDICKASLS